jgi:hypothetical protein
MLDAGIVGVVDSPALLEDSTGPYNALIIDVDR